MNQQRIYCDYNATWPMAEKDFYLLNDRLSSSKLNDNATATFNSIASLLGCENDELFVTSGGTEGNNLLIQTLFHYHYPKKKHFITTAVEHPSVLKTARYIENHGGEITLLPVEQDGLLILEQLKTQIREDTFLVSAMYANNETGVIFPIREIEQICKNHCVEFHTDAVQVLGKIPLSFHDMRVTYSVVSAHKIGASMGLGFLYAQHGSSFSKIAHHEMKTFFEFIKDEKRPYLELFHQVFQERLENLTQESQRLLELQHSFIQWLKQSFHEVVIFGENSPRISNTINFAIKNIEGESLLLALDLHGIAASSGSACSSGALEPSHVITAMKYPPEIAHGAVRLSFGKSIGKDEITSLQNTLKEIIIRLYNIK